MPYISRFSRRVRQVIPSSNQSEPITRLDFRGLDTTSPYDVVQNNRSPFAHDFRIYAEESDSRRVAISSRKGSGTYVTALSEAADQQNTSATGAADQSIGVVTEWKAMKFTAGVTGPLTKLELRLKKTTSSSGPIVIKVYTNNAGIPGTLIGESGILNSDISTSYAYVPAHFIEAPAVTSGSVYWIVAYIQDDGSNTYSWSSNTSTTLALTSNTTGQSWASTAYSLNFKTYVCSTALIKGGARYAPTSAENRTVIPIGTSVYSVDDVTGAMTAILTGQNANATHYYFAYADDKLFWVNGFDNLKTWDGTTVETITHANLPILSNIIFHNNLLIGISAADPNRFVYSEAPGNDDGSGNLWYKAYLSTSFQYVPTSKASDPLTGMAVFQDNLYFFTRSAKYALYGKDPGSFLLRQSTGKKGAVSQGAIHADENYIYFAAPDGFYRFNGAKDEIISDFTWNRGGSIQSEYASIADVDKVFVTKWKRGVRMYYPSSGAPVNDSCVIWHTVFQEWLRDTDSFVSFAIPLTDGNDDDKLVELSSVCPRATYAEQDYNNLGKAINFEYHCKNDSLGMPAVRKRITKFFPLLEGDGGNYPVQVGVDKDMENETRYVDYELAEGGVRIGEFSVGDGTLIEKDVQFSPKRFRISGYAYYWQPRIKRRAINNRVRFIGYTLAIRTKRL